MEIRISSRETKDGKDAGYKVGGAEYFGEAEEEPIRYLRRISEASGVRRVLILFLSMLYSKM